MLGRTGSKGQLHLAETVAPIAASRTPDHWPFVRLAAERIGHEEGHTSFPVGQIFSPYAGTSGSAAGCPPQLAQNTERHRSCLKLRHTGKQISSEGKDA